MDCSLSEHPTFKKAPTIVNQIMKKTPSRTPVKQSNDHLVRIMLIPKRLYIRRDLRAEPLVAARQENSKFL
jgi:hypothetical protein